MGRRVAFTGFPYGHRWALFRPWVYVSWLWRELWWFFQRGFYGFAHGDVWNLDDYLVTWLPDALRLIAEAGYPGGFTSEEWTQFLYERADILEESADHWDLEYYKENQLLHEAQEALKDIADWFWHLWT